MAIALAKDGNIRKLGRWLIRLKAYSDAGGSWLSAIEGLVSIVFGVRNGLLEGMITLLMFRLARAVVGYWDFRYLKATDYYNEVMGRFAPGRVKVIR